AALEPVTLDEGSLQRMERIALSQALDRRDRAAVHEGSEPQAGLHPLAIHQRRAGAALAEAAAFLRSCEVKVLAQRVEQRGARVERQAVFGSVDAQYDVKCSGHSVGGLRGGRVAALHGVRSFGRRQDLSYRQSTAGSRGDLQQLSSCCIEG